MIFHFSFLFFISPVFTETGSYVYFFLHTYRATAFFFTSIHSVYLFYLFIFHHSRTLLVLILISGDDFNKL